MITKINEEFKFKLIKRYNVDNIRDHLNSFDSQWLLDKSRQTLYEAHRFTNSYILYDHSNAWEFGNDYKIKKVSDDTILLGLVDSIIKDLEKIHDGRVGKALFIKLPAGKVVDPHWDSGDYLGMVRRHHIAIKTNPNVYFIIDGESKNMEYGDCWEINNSREHSVKNESSEERIHLLIDIMPNSFFQGEKND